MKNITVEYQAFNTRRNVEQTTSVIYSVCDTFKYLNDRFPYSFIYLNLWNPYPFKYLKPKKGSPFGRKECVVCNTGIKQYPLVPASFHHAPATCSSSCVRYFMYALARCPTVCATSNQMFIQHFTYCNRTYLNYLESNEHWHKSVLQNVTRTLPIK